MPHTKTYLGRLFYQKRCESRLRSVDVVKAAGYRNINKGIRRYEAIERGCIVFPKREILQPFNRTLGIDEITVLMAICREWVLYYDVDMFPSGKSSWGISRRRCRLRRLSMVL
jgi:hypothetical protein